MTLAIANVGENSEFGQLLKQFRGAYEENRAKHADAWGMNESTMRGWERTGAAQINRLKSELLPAMTVPERIAFLQWLADGFATVMPVEVPDECDTASAAAALEWAVKALQKFVPFVDVVRAGAQDGILWSEEVMEIRDAWLRARLAGDQAVLIARKAVGRR